MVIKSITAVSVIIILVMLVIQEIYSINQRKCAEIRRARYVSRQKRIHAALLSRKQR